MPESLAILIAVAAAIAAWIAATGSWRSAGPAKRSADAAEANVGAASRAATAAEKSATAAEATAAGEIRAERTRWVERMVPIITREGIPELFYLVGTLPPHLQSVSDELIVEAVAQAGGVGHMHRSQGFLRRFPGAWKRLEALIP